MRIRFASIAAPLLLGGSVLLSGCATPSTAVAPTSADSSASVAQLKAQLRAQSDAWDKAILRKDRAAIAANMAEDFRQIDASGNVDDKKTFVDDLLDPDFSMEPYTLEEFDIRLLGDDVALLSARMRITGQYKGKAFSNHYRYIDIYQRRDGVWKIVSVQMSKLPQ